MASEKMRVMVVDDEKLIRDFFRRLLSFMGLEVVEAEDGNRAVELAKNEDYDIYFIDVRMPGIDGVETYRKIREVKNNPIVIMMTGYAVEDLLGQAVKEGAQGVIRKPFEINEIKSVIDGVSGRMKKGALNILVVDDEELIHHFFAQLLQGKEISFKSARNKQDALKAARQEKFDLVFLDLMLGQESGVDVYKEIKNILPEADIVLITGFPQKGREIEGQIDISGCLYKPFEIESVFEAIEKAKTKAK